ncbi:MAG: hypothetical protein JNN13_14550 [Planctomycetes bacterium]|nr:hypothetical protein [Planctomycetota bacterium]
MPRLTLAPCAGALPFVFALTMLAAQEPGPDWLVDATAYGARIEVDGDTLTLTNGLIARRLKLLPNAGTVAFDDLMTGASLLRATKPEASLTIDGVRREIGGLVSGRVKNFLTPANEAAAAGQPGAWQLARWEARPVVAPFAWQPRAAWLSRPPRPWPPAGKALALTFAPADETGLEATVVYELYDGIPLLSKRIELRNDSSMARRVDGVEVELLALTETGSMVGGDADVGLRDFRALHVETDYAFGGAMEASSDNPSVQFVPDPEYDTQVHYERQAPCLLRCAPRIGPGVTLAVGATFESFRVFELVFDSSERERRGMARRRMYRTIAPWCEENPLIFHVRHADDSSVRAAVDQAAAAGFELVLMTFGSGFDAEDISDANVARLKALADYAHEKGVALGGYSLLASRAIDGDNDVVDPATGKTGGFARFGNSPCLCSVWGREYFAKLRYLFERTGLDALEHDGSYPGDLCASTTHVDHHDVADSQWRQWTRIRDLYRWARGRGIYLNVPDWYFLSGSNKTGMGYRETNWSLPREDQVLIERQNVYDGTWNKTPTMGWMFVPLTEYHGGGPAATIEPLVQHLDHYEARFANLLGAGVQACWRGPRLYDSDRTLALVRRWTGWFKANRALLEADVVHGRRADGRDVDWLLHVDPTLPQKAMLVVYNPLPAAVARTLTVDLTLAGCRDAVTARFPDGVALRLDLDPRQRARVPATVPARGFTWILMQ